MKKIIFSLLFFCSVILAQSKPVSGEFFSVTYNPASKGILTDAKEITLVYTFDYWGTLPSAPNNASDLFKNVETPDPGKARSEKMTKEGKLWKASVRIPEDAALLSYYFTDGQKNDYNNKKTYVSYIYDKKMKPVKNARFRNLDFIAMSGKPIDAQLKEIEREVKDYPDNFLAHFVYWNKNLENANDCYSLMKLRPKIDSYFAKLEKKYKDNYDLLNLKARTYLQISNHLSRVVKNDYLSIGTKSKEIIFSIPPDKMTAAVKKAYDLFRREEEAADFSKNIVGKAAPDFEFETIKGEKHKLSDFKGKYVLLDFWGTWCAPCVREIPNLKNAYKTFKEKGFEIISISSDAFNGGKDKEYLKKFTEEKEMTWNHILDSRVIHDTYKIKLWPTVYLVDKEGKIVRDDTTLRSPNLENTLSEVLQ